MFVLKISELQNKVYPVGNRNRTWFVLFGTLVCLVGICCFA